ncbi:unnamed protein product [Polarella glacialis]|uniref:Uncharacterized protein n=1 Tax=Polarella glacialis TaxID=89957 RepID=A0A813EJB5_POLGL|nr:unnamed protein product [Polarella glacialis]
MGPLATATVGEQTGCSRTKCAAAAQGARIMPLFHLQGLLSQHSPRRQERKDVLPPDLEFRYSLALLASGRCARVAGGVTTCNPTDVSESCRHKKPCKEAESSQLVLRLQPLPALPREVVLRILSFAVERFVRLRGRWGFSCELCNMTYSFRKYPEAALHLRAQRHARRLEALQAGRLLAVAQTGVEVSRFVDGLGLRGQFCSPQHVEEARRLVPLALAAEGVDLSALRASGAKGAWVSPETMERAGRIAALRGVSAEGARHRKDSKRWLLFAPGPGAEWSEELAQELAEIDTFDRS